MPNNPDTLPADFFNRKQAEPGYAPDSLPADFFHGSQPPGLTPGSQNSDAASRFAAGLANSLNPIPGIEAIATDPQGLKHGIEQNIFQPQREQFIKAGEAAQGKGEFSGMTPGERLSETLGHGAAGFLPLAGPAAANAGDQIGSGDVAGGLGSGLGLASTIAIPDLMHISGRGLSRGAEPIAENALGIRNVDRKFARSPGRAALDETSGFRPETISSQAANRIADLAARRDTALTASPNKVSLRPPRDFIDHAIASAAAGNSDTSHLIPMREQLNDPKPGFAGNTAPINAPPPGTIGPSGPLKISELQDPMNALAIRQRFGKDFTKFDMGRPVSKETQEVGNKVYGRLTDAIHSAVPESAPLDHRISNLIPVKESADVKSIEAPTLQQVMRRIAAKTGVLAAGTVAGAHYGNPVIGAAMGALIPELLSNPEVQMAAARGLDTSGRLIRNPFVSRSLQTAQNLRPGTQASAATRGDK